MLIAAEINPLASTKFRERKFTVSLEKEAIFLIYKFFILYSEFSHVFIAKQFDFQNQISTCSISNFLFRPFTVNKISTHVEFWEEIQLYINLEFAFSKLNDQINFDI